MITSGSLHTTEVTPMALKIEDLPDYFSFKKLAASLWQEHNTCHGASIMVGAGFTRSAAYTEDVKEKIPLWPDLSKKLAIELGTGSTDPLRLAEEYSAYFGKRALRDFINKEINDDIWEPGELYSLLLGLPWTEVLTTNWDTLLEKASKEVNQPIYNIVSKQEDLSYARSPRIVKLHGTIGQAQDLIFTQENYRKYPDENAAFVNFARQVFIENELCLIGFSGDDPNFIQWTGWVRDQLTNHSRRIYLVGALNLSPAKRKYLETINVAPIDLYELVSDYDDPDTSHKKAITLFLQGLVDLKPQNQWEWQPMPIENADTIAHKLAQLEKSRKNYPGWLVCPGDVRWLLQTQLHDFSLLTPSLLVTYDPKMVEKLLYEVAWNYSITFQIIDTWLVDELLKVCDPALPSVLTKRQQLEIALLLLKNSRWSDCAEDVESKVIEILEREARHWPECKNELLFHTALVARDKFNFDELRTLAEQIETSDCTWKLKKASLLVEVAKFSESAALVTEAYQDLLIQHRKDPSSVYILSRLMWAEFLLPNFDKRKISDTEKKCDPWDHIQQLKNKALSFYDKQQKKKDIEPSFEPGLFKRNSDTIILSNEIHPLLIFEGISNSVGMPVRIEDKNFCPDILSKLAMLELENVGAAGCFVLALRAAHDENDVVLKKVFSRTKIACLTPNEVDHLLDCCLKGVTFWKELLLQVGSSDTLKLHILSRLRVFLEALARTSIRSTGERAKEIFLFATDLGKNDKLQHPWLFDCLDHLIQYSLKSVPKSQHFDLLPASLSFPFQPNSQDFLKKWPTPIINDPGERQIPSRMDRLISQTIEGVGSTTLATKTSALVRLLPLYKANFLTESECKELSKQIWKESLDFKKLPSTGLLESALLEFPSESPEKVKELVYKHLFETEDWFNESRLQSMINISYSKNIKDCFSPDYALKNFKTFVAWRPTKPRKSFFGAPNDSYLTDLISSALTYSIVPALSDTMFTKENFTKLCCFYTEVEAPAVLCALPYFGHTNKDFVGDVEGFIRGGLQDKDAKKVGSAARSLLIWRELGDSEEANQLIERFVYFVGVYGSSALTNLLWVVEQMCEKEFLSQKNLFSLSTTLPIIFDSFQYREVVDASYDSVNISLTRAACVRLANKVNKKCSAKTEELIHLIEKSQTDALPEVRFALQN